MNDIHELRAENERLVAEVERLQLAADESSSLYAQWRDDCAARAEAAEAEVERLRNASKQNAVQASRADRRADREEARAEAAEAKVAKVEALADEWESFGRVRVAYHWDKVGQMVRRAVLADAPAEQRAEGGA